MDYNSKIENLYPKEFEILRKYGQLKDEWANVYEHCKTESVIALVISDLLKLKKDEKDILAKAAILHDWYKRKERETQEYNKSAKDSYNKLLELGVDKRIVDIAHSVGHTSLLDIQATHDFLKKIMHFIDDITFGNEIVEIDERIDELEKAERYKELNEGGRVVYNGRTYFEVQREVGVKIQCEIEELINETNLEELIKKGELVQAIKINIKRYY